MPLGTDEETWRDDLHRYVALANNPAYSDCRVQVPSKERYERDAGRLTCHKQDPTIAASIDIASLRSFQSDALNAPTMDPNPNSYKPSPPRYEFRRV